MSSQDPLFSPNEFNCLNDKDFLLTKIEVTTKIVTLLGKVEQALAPAINANSWPNQVLAKSGKISKGEMYEGLPYFILDFPRYFHKENVFAFRTLCWWGNFFSSTLHLSGSYLEDTRGNLISATESIIASNAYICVNENPWEYHYRPNNYLAADQFDQNQLAALFNARAFIKISHKWGLEAYAHLPQLVVNSFQQTISWLNA